MLCQGKGGGLRLPGQKSQTPALVWQESLKNDILDADWSNLCHMTKTTKMANTSNKDSSF